MKFYKILFIWCLLNSLKILAFNNLQELIDYAEALEEHPKWDNKDPLDPDYSTYHVQQTKTFLPQKLNKLLQNIGLKRKSAWSAELLVSILKTVTESREKSGKKGNFIEKIIPNPGSKFIVWGDVQGAFHSLIRDLNYLKSQNIIDLNLKIEPDHYFVFNSDVIDRSPYSLETLTLVIFLINKNPNQVFYIKGNHEEGKYWHDYGTKRELQIKAKHLAPKETVPLDASLRRFFNTLPLAIFLKSQDKYSHEIAFARISGFDVQEKSILNEDNFAEFLLKDPDPHKIFKLDTTQLSDSYIDLKAIIKAVSRSATYEPTNGLSLIMPDMGATTWTLLSCPTSTYQTLYKFFNDAFVTLAITPSINDWTLTLHTQDIRKLPKKNKMGINYFTSSTRHFLTGRALSSEDEIIEAKEIRIGSINDFKKSTSATGTRLRNGIALRIQKANIENEIPGKYIRLIILDDEYTPRLAVQAMNKLLTKYKTDIIIQTLGSPTQEALLPYIQQGKVLVLFNFAGPAKFRTPELTYNIHYRTSYEYEARTMVEYAITKMNLKSFAIIYQNDAFGMALRKGAVEALEQHKMSFVDASYPRNTLNIEVAAKKVLETDPEVIFCFGTTPPFIALIQKLGIEYVASKTLIGPTFLTDIFRSMLETRGLNVILTRIVPNPFSEIEIAKEYREALKKYRPGTEVSVDMFEAYINASLFVEATKTLKGEISKEKLIEFFHGMKNVKFKGLNINYHPQTQELSK